MPHRPIAIARATLVAFLMLTMFACREETAVEGTTVDDTSFLPSAPPIAPIEHTPPNDTLELLDPPPDGPEPVPNGADLVLLGESDAAETGSVQGLAVGDLNGDGIDDLVIGAPRSPAPDGSRADAGRAYVVFGTTAYGPASDAAVTLELADATAVRFIGATTGARLGEWVAAADLDGDGVDELILSAPGADGGAGSVWIFDARGIAAGATRDLALETAPIRLDGAPGDGFGIGLAATDLNGDGAAELLIGAPGKNGPAGDRIDAGAVYLVFGGAAIPTDLAGASLIHGATAGGALGIGLAAADFDGDGAADLALGAPGIQIDFGNDGRPELPRELETLPAGTDHGRVALLYGPIAAGVTIDLEVAPPDFVAIGVAGGDALGVRVAAFDLNADGFADLGASGYFPDAPDDRTDAGAVYLLDGGAARRGGQATVTAAADHVILGSGARTRLGTMASGDLDGDGAAELLLGSCTSEGPDTGGDAGEVAILSGAEPLPAVFDLAAESTPERIYGELGDEGFGFSLAVGDLNGDGAVDWIAGAPDVGAGKLYLFFDAPLS